MIESYFKKFQKDDRDYHFRKENFSPEKYFTFSPQSELDEIENEKRKKELLRLKKEKEKHLRLLEKLTKLKSRFFEILNLYQSSKSFEKPKYENLILNIRLQIEETEKQISEI